METRDEEAAGLRADVAAAREELQQARTTLADTSAKDKADRLEAEILEARASLKEKDSSISQARPSSLSLRTNHVWCLLTQHSSCSAADTGQVAHPLCDGVAVGAVDRGCRSAMHQNAPCIRRW